MNFRKEQITQTTITSTLSFDEVAARLAVSEAVDGLALFGSRSTDEANPISDYDLLILVKDLPVRIFQMLTHIEQRMADIVFVETEIADRVLVSAARVSANSFEGMFLLKMRKAQIIHDASGRLGRVQQLIKQEAQLFDRLMPSTEPALYAAWFWQNHGLYHMKRMIQSSDPTYLTAVDMMMVSNLSEVCRAYCCVRNVPWQGEKMAVRYLQIHDPEYLALLRECLSASDRGVKLSLYERLVIKTLEPVGGIWTPGLTAVYLADPSQHVRHIDTALAFWESLFSFRTAT